MKLLAYLKITLKEIIRQFPVFLLSYALYPMIIALVLGYAQKDMFTPTINAPIFSIIIVDEDNTFQSQNLVSFLNNEETSKLMTIEQIDSKKFDYTLRIPNGYENSLTGGNPATIKVEAEEKSSTTMGNILVNIVDRYNIEASKGLVVQRNIYNNPLSIKEKQELVDEISTVINKTHSTNSIKANIHSTRKSLDSYEYFSITFLSFAFIIFLSSVITSDALEKDIGLHSRIMSTSMTKFQYLNYGIMSNYLTMITANILYVSGYRLAGLSFQGSLPILLLIILVQSLMITIIGTLISTIFKKKYGLPFVQILLLFQMILGGVIGPLNNLSNNKIPALLSKYKPDILISNTFKNYIIYNNLSSISNYLLITIGISFVLYIINILAIRMKWGVK